MNLSSWMKSLFAVIVVFTGVTCTPANTTPPDGQYIYFDVPVGSTEVKITFIAGPGGLSFSIKNPEKTTNDDFATNVFYQGGILCPSTSYPHTEVDLAYSSGTWELSLEYYSDIGITDPILASPNGAGTWLFVIKGLSVTVTPTITGGTFL